MLRIKTAFAAVCLLFLSICCLAQPYPEPPHNRIANTLSDNWLAREPDGGLVPFDPVYSPKVSALHQWVRFVPGRPFVISFSSRRDLCLFLNNRLVFRAHRAGEHTVDLSNLAGLVNPSNGKMLFTISHPTELPAYWSYHTPFTHANPSESAVSEAQPRLLKTEKEQYTYIFFLLGLGFLYGFLRVNYGTDWAAIYNPAFLKRLATEDTFYKKPIGSVSSFLFLLAFALSMSLATIAVQRNLQETLTLGRVFEDNRSGVVSSIVLGTAVVIVAMLLKLVFLQLVAFIFNYQKLVPIQYREFIRSSMFFGIGLPVILVLYLSFGQAGQAQVGLAANGMLMLLLTVPMVRVLYLVGSRYRLADVQLFCYLCATEIIPLAIILKIIFLSY